MTKAKEKSPLQELAEEADLALELCWERLKAQTTRRRDVETMAEAWRVKREEWLEKEEMR